MFTATKPLGAPGKGVAAGGFENPAHAPWSPRRSFDEEELRGLGGTIRTNGIIQPLTVRRSRSGAIS